MASDIDELTARMSFLSIKESKESSVPMLCINHISLSNNSYKMPSKRTLLNPLTNRLFNIDAQMLLICIVLMLCFVIAMKPSLVVLILPSVIIFMCFKRSKILENVKHRKRSFDNMKL